MSDTICIGMQVTLSYFWEKLHEKKNESLHGCWLLLLCRKIRNYTEVQL